MTMAKKNFLFLSDVVNGAQVISKDHGPLIDKGTVVSLDPENASTKWLLEAKAIQEDEQQQDPSVLEQSADKVIKALDGLSQDELEALLAEEQAGKNRKTVIEAIENNLKSE